MPRPRKAALVLALCALPLAALTACSSSTGSASSGSSGSKSSGSSGTSASSNVARPKDMCALLSTAEASTAFATKISSTYAPEKTGCNYDGEDLHFDTMLTPTEIDSFGADASLLKLDIGKLATISGVGDQAAGNAKGIVVRVGKVMFDLETEPGTTSTTQDQIVAAAKVMVSHLG